MKQILKIFLTHLAGIYILSQIISGVTFKNGLNGLIIASIILILILKVVKPIINLIMLPINLLTLNLSAWLVDIVLIFIWMVITPGVSLSSWNFPGISTGVISLKAMSFVSWQVIILSGILLTLILKFLKWITS